VIYLERKKIATLRDYKVVKNNKLIQKARYNLSAQEQKIVLYLISKIKPADTEFELYEFRIKDFCEVCGIDERSGWNYAFLKKAMKDLADKSVWVTLDNGLETIVRWVERPYIDKRSGTIKIKIDELMRPFLLELKAHFTSYSIYYTLAMRSKYSIRIYEMLKSYENLGEYTIELDILKKKLFAEKYPVYKDFRVKVLDVAMREINDFTDISVTFITIKNGKKVDKIKFKITPKKDLKERVETFKKIEQKISLKQMSEVPNIFISYDDEPAIIDRLMGDD
jgi:plasmid replication initiation protein